MVKRDIAILGSYMKLNNFGQKVVQSKKVYNRKKIKNSKEGKNEIYSNDSINYSRLS